MRQKEMLANQIRSAQNVGKVWISRTKVLLARFGPIPSNFFPWAEQIQNFKNLVNFPWWANGPYSSGLAGRGAAQAKLWNLLLLQQLVSPRPAQPRPKPGPSLAQARPRDGLFQNPNQILLQECDKWDPVVFQNLKFPKSNIPCIQNELVLS